MDLENTRKAVKTLSDKKKIDLNTKINEIIEAASKTGADTNLFYVTTLDRYNTQMKIMEDLKKAIAADGMTVEKEYVKGRINIVINPAVTEYNKTASAANNTVQTLIKIVQALNATSIMDAADTEDDEM